MYGSVQIAGEDINEYEVRNICDSLKNNTIRLLSLRGCRIEDAQFVRLSEALKLSESLAQLNLNLGVVNSLERIKELADALMENTSIVSLFLHGTPMKDEGLTALIPALEKHSKLQSLDVGDCKLGDDAIQQLCRIIAPTSPNHAGLLELTATGNRDVSPSGWVQLAMAIGSGCSLQSLFLDYNNIGDFGMAAFSVALAASKTLQVVDFEGCGITNAGAELLCDLVATYETQLRDLNLAENNISKDLLQEIKDIINENVQRTSDNAGLSGSHRFGMHDHTVNV